MDLHHLVLSTVGRQPLLPDAAARRAAIRALVRIAAERLWLFCLVDEHLHAVVQGADPRRLGGHLALAFGALGAPALQPAWAEAIEGREHLRRLVPYLLRQAEHHGLGPAAAWDGSCFLDLVGARRIPGFDATAWRRGLPREDDALVWSAVNLPKPPGIEVRGCALETLVAAASRSVAADPALRGRHHEVVRARRIVVALSDEAGFPAAAIASALRCDRDTVWRLAGTADPDDVLAARRALAIDAALLRRRAA